MANKITLFRVLLVFLILSMIKINPIWNLIAVILIAITMFLDAIDGLVARHFNTSTLNGSIYDILADRIIENIFFIYFASNHLIGVWAPIIICVRGLIIDTLRAISFSHGKTPFGTTTLHQKSWTIYLACSKTSRGLYNTFKMLTFMCYAAIMDKQNILFNVIDEKSFNHIAFIFLCGTIVLCLLRAIPVIWEGLLIANKSSHTSIIEN